MPKGFVTEIKTLFLGREVMLNLLVCIVWASSMLGYMRGIINHIPVLGDYTDQVEVMIVVLPLLLSLPILVGRLNYRQPIHCFCIPKNSLKLPNF